MIKKLFTFPRYKLSINFLPRTAVSAFNKRSSARSLFTLEQKSESFYKINKYKLAVYTIVSS